MANYFNSNLKFIREQKGLSKNKLGEMTGVNQSTIGRWETGEIKPTIDNVVDLMNALGMPIDELGEFLGKDLRFDNAEYIDISSSIIKIPVYGTIKAGVPLENQTDIIDYVDIPKKWTLGNKKFYGLKISGDSMFPKYDDGDIVIFEQNNDTELYNGKDVAIMINGTESTFKKILVNDQGIVLQPYNAAYDIMMFTKEQVEQLPIRVVGIAKEKRTKID